jgi:hypothetical protein
MYTHVETYLLTMLWPHHIQMLESYPYQVMVLGGAIWK